VARLAGREACRRSFSRPCNYAAIRSSRDALPVHDFAAVHDEHVWQVYGFFAYRLSNRSEAEDLTQLTF
jgi:hypothetical protein